MPKNLNQVTSGASEDVKIAGMRSRLAPSIENDSGLPQGVTVSSVMP